MKSIVSIILRSGAGAIILGSVLDHPDGPVKAATPAKPLLVGADIDPLPFTVLERSCQDCHSERTRWPWYSYIASMSWLVESDVGQARSKMNFSRWDEYTAERKEEILASVGAVMRSGEMPPARYTLIHKDAKLSSVEREQIYQWARAERRAVKSTMPTAVGTGQ